MRERERERERERKLIPIQKKIKNPKKALSQSNFWRMKPGRERKLIG